MASGKGGKKHMGLGAQGKGDGSGAMSTMPENLVGENDILSNRDKAQHTKERGLDGNDIRNEQHQDHPANRLPDEE
ncbi:hypothetical protein NGM99_19365 [Mesorhizobium sp. RP14(2022)]|jgi:hypothetical protein|uniref:Uncharacterized protein n=1 Tax=Mesorhizobium liriopis TaxID=2953882 RepID=A0ABT1CDD4_9HYPH|nr:hypothetical protein [Mesorhizobium liriopis]MCO6051951.1 hypothetical protein [Mesorhizobium liriopis]